jgi:hypothetical protein
MIEYATSIRVSSRSLTQNWVHDSIIHGCARIIPVHGGREKPNKWPNTAFTPDTDINDQQHVDMLVQNVWEGPGPFSQRKYKSLGRHPKAGPNTPGALHGHLFWDPVPPEHLRSAQIAINSPQGCRKGSNGAFEYPISSYFPMITEVVEKYW